MSCAGAIDHPAPEIEHEPGFLRNRNEQVGRQQLAAGTVPAQQCFGANTGSVEIMLGLIVEFELIGILQCGLQFLLDFPAPFEIRRQLPIVVDAAVESSQLGLVHRRVGASQDLLGIAVAVRKQLDAGRRRDVEPMLARQSSSPKIPC